MNNFQKQFYLSKFKNKVFVLKVGGEVINSKGNLKNILKDIKSIHDFGIHIILVHGGGTQADDLAFKLGHSPIKIKGRRVTTKKDLEIVKMLYGGTLNLEILSIMKQIGLKGIRVSGLDGNLLDVKKRAIKKVDYGYVGDINNVNPQILSDLISKGYLPIISPLAVSNNGTILNINADTIATEIAIAMQAEKLILFTKTDGVYKGSKLISVLTPKEGMDLINKKIAKNGMVVKIQNCIHAVKNNVKRIHILNGLSEHSLLNEVLTQKGVGTMFTNQNEKNTYLKE